MQPYRSGRVAVTIAPASGFPLHAQAQSRDERHYRDARLVSTLTAALTRWSAMRTGRLAAAAVTGAALSEAALVALGRSYGSTKAERARLLPGDDIVANPTVVTDHAITVDATPGDVWPWLVQMGWGRGGWYTPRWVDRLLFPANGPSARRIQPELQDLKIGDFVPDGPPETKCGLYVEVLEPERALVLHSTSHLPLSWRDRAELDWSWAFILTPLDEGQRTRYHFRSRWTTSPWWFTAGGLLGIVPADFYMSRGMLRGVRERAEATARQRRGGSIPQQRLEGVEGDVPPRGVTAGVSCGLRGRSVQP